MDGNTRLISIVIGAHDRKEFLIDAVSSVLSQNYGKDGYEIVVVKNFSDANIDGFLSANNVVSILSDAKNLSNKHAVGINHSKGDIICFLDDDDLFEPQKLKTIRESFDSITDLSFIHNGMFFSDYGGSIIEQMKKFDAILFDPSDCKPGIIRKMLQALVTYNCSSMSISGEMARKYAPIIDQTSQESDTFWFLAALDFGGRLLCLPDYLTRYRRHRGGISRSFEENKISWYAGSALRNMYKMASLFTSQCALNFLSFKTTEWKIKRFIFDDDFQNSGFYLFLEVIKFFRMIPARDSAKLFILTLTVNISRKFSKYLYTKFYI